MRANVYELMRHPFITKAEFTAPLAHLNRLPTINEQASAISDASPFNQQHGFFSKKDAKKGNMFGFGKTNYQNSNLYDTRSPYTYEIQDKSPYSQVSCKTQKNTTINRL